MIRSRSSVATAFRTVCMATSIASAGVVSSMVVPIPARGRTLGAILLKQKIANVIKPGQHGTTFGGGPLACRASLEYFNILEEENLLERIRAVGTYFKHSLEELKDLPVVKEIRGSGLMLAVELEIPGKDIVKQLLSQGFIINCTHDTVLRMLPPFVITEKQIDKFIRALRGILEACSVPQVQAHSEL